MTFDRAFGQIVWAIVGDSLSPARVRERKDANDSDPYRARTDAWYRTDDEAPWIRAWPETHDSDRPAEAVCVRCEQYLGLWAPLDDGGLGSKWKRQLAAEGPKTVVLDLHPSPLEVRGFRIIRGPDSA